MLYKHLFSILCGHLNLNQKRKKFEFDRLPVKPAGKPVKPTGKPFGTGRTCDFEFDFEFDRFPPVSTGFRSNRSGKPLPDRTGLTGQDGLLNPLDAASDSISSRVRPASEHIRTLKPSPTAEPVRSSVISLPHRSSRPVPRLSDAIFASCALSPPRARRSRDQQRSSPS